MTRDSLEQTFNIRGHEKLEDKTSSRGRAWRDDQVKQAHMFAKLEHELGEPGKIAIDVTGVELQRKFDVLEDVMRAPDPLRSGQSWDGKRGASISTPCREATR